MHNFVRGAKALLLVAATLTSSVSAWAHPPAENLPPTKATASLAEARKLMDTAKQKLTTLGRYACCIKAPQGGRVAGCDLCARQNGSCTCGANLASGKGVCGDCLGAWRAGQGAVPGIKPESVLLLASPQQSLGATNTDANVDVPELAKARIAINVAKKTLVGEGRFSCCVGKGGCDECAYETNCPCGQAASEGAKGEGICGQCYDGWHAGIGRLAGLTAQEMHLQAGHGNMNMAQGANSSGHSGGQNKTHKDGMQSGMQGMNMGGGQHSMEANGLHSGMTMDDMPGMMAPIAGVRMNQQASGTSWMPAASPMYMQGFRSGRWNLMFHYNAFFSYDRQEGPRGDYQYNSTNWAMLMAQRAIGKDRLLLRTMLSLEPLTVTPGGFPLLFQSGEQYGGKPLVDRQHPHDLFMELAATYTHPTGKDSAVFAYAAPSGEPALGPTAFMHRLSALDNPVAPITHHWQDSTHIEFGVLTLGAWKRNVQIEGSYFTGREPDEYRYDFSPFHPDSFSGRLTYNPGPNWSLQTSYGYLHSPEQLRPDEDIRRTTASAQYTLPFRGGGFWATTLAYGNNSTHGSNSDSFLLESEWNIANRNTLFGRYEFVNKLGEELAIAPEDRKFGISALTIGGVHDFTPNRPYQTGVGAAVTFNTHPSSLNGLYGSSPTGYWLFLRIRPSQMRHTMH